MLLETFTSVDVVVVNNIAGAVDDVIALLRTFECKIVMELSEVGCEK
jgi:hypothetical protein